MWVWWWWGQGGQTDRHHHLCEGSTHTGTMQRPGGRSKAFLHGSFLSPHMLKPQTCGVVCLWSQRAPWSLHLDLCEHRFQTSCSPFSLSCLISSTPVALEINIFELAIKSSAAFIWLTYFWPHHEKLHDATCSMNLKASPCTEVQSVSCSFCP